MQDHPFPTITRTKAEARALAAEIFPDEPAALAAYIRAHPDCKHPRYALAQDAAEKLRFIFDWLFDDHTRIYKRARWHLFYDLAHRLVYLLDENGSGKARDIHAEFRAADWQRLQASWLMTGNGDGI